MQRKTSCGLQLKGRIELLRWNEIDTGGFTTNQALASYENQQNNRKFSTPHRVTDGKKFRLSDVDPGDTGDLEVDDKPRVKEALQTGIERKSSKGAY